VRVGENTSVKEGLRGFPIRIRVSYRCHGAPQGGSWAEPVRIMGNHQCVPSIVKWHALTLLSVSEGVGVRLGDTRHENGALRVLTC
jgi:hypothetical protein